MIARTTRRTARFAFVLAVIIITAPVLMPLVAWGVSGEDD